MAKKGFILNIFYRLILTHWMSGLSNSLNTNGYDIKYSLIKLDKTAVGSFKTYNVDGRISCNLGCEYEPRCVTFTFNKNRKECQLFDVNLNETEIWSNDGGNEVFLMITEGQNLARSKPTFKSSIVAGRSSEQAVDGDITPQDYGLQTVCFQTPITDLNPWFIVDLEDVYIIKFVVVYNADDYPERLHDVNYELFQTNPAFDNASVPNCCASVVNFNKGKNIIRCNENVSGRFLKISIQKSNFLTLCEVEVYGVLLEGNDLNSCGSESVKCKQLPGGPNVALHKPSTQSTMWASHIPEYANDGIVPTVVNYCQHTDNDLNPWWQVDLESTYNITSVTIANRFDDKPSTGHRLADTSILVYETTPASSTTFTLCKFIPGVFGCTIRTFECNGIAIGRWVRITKPTEYLTLCEVEVTGGLIYSVCSSSSARMIFLHFYMILISMKFYLVKH